MYRTYKNPRQYSSALAKPPAPMMAKKMKRGDSSIEYESFHGAAAKKSASGQQLLGPSSGTPTLASGLRFESLEEGGASSDGGTASTTAPTRLIQ